MEGMSARSLRALEEHEGASGGVPEHWRSMEEFGQRGETRGEILN